MNVPDHLRGVWLKLIWRSDTTTIRLVLAVASLLWAGSVWVNPHVMDRPPYQVLNAAAHGWIHPLAWGGLFFMHFVLVMWRMFDPRSRVYMGLVVNVYGLILWLSVTTTLALAMGFLHVDLAADWALCLFAGWTLFKTGLSEEPIEP